GAGAIIRDRGRVIGETTAASVWAVAAIGVVIGGGYVAAGVLFTIVVLAMLVGVGGIEQWAQGPCRIAKMRIVARREGGKAHVLIVCRLSRSSARIEDELENAANDTVEMTVSYCHSHRHHATFVEEVANM